MSGCQSSPSSLFEKDLLVFLFVYQGSGPQACRVILRPHGLYLWILPWDWVFEAGPHICMAALLPMQPSLQSHVILLTKSDSFWVLTSFLC